MATKNTHKAVHSIQFYDTKLKQSVEIKAGSEFNPDTVNGDVDWDRLQKSGAVKKLTAKAAADTNTDTNTDTDTEVEPDEYDLVLDNNIADVEDAIYAEPRDTDWLAALRAREVKGKNRVGVLEVIDGYESEAE